MPGPLLLQKVCSLFEKSRLVIFGVEQLQQPDSGVGDGFVFQKPQYLAVEGVFRGTVGPGFGDSKNLVVVEIVRDFDDLVVLQLPAPVGCAFFLASHEFLDPE